MATTDTAAARYVNKRFALAALLISTSLGLAGCGTSNLLGQGGSSSAELAPPTAESAQVAAVNRTVLTVAPVVGAPENVGKGLAAQMSAALEKQNIGVTKSPAEKSDYSLRGYMVAAKERSGTKLSYIWDLTDPAGKRVNRLQGEEVMAGGNGSDPWAAVTPQLIQKITDKTATELAAKIATLPKAGGGAISAGPAIAANSVRPTPVAAPATGSIGRPGAVTTLIPNVVGAPGDGSTSLRAALKNELSRNGVGVSDQNVAGAYRVEGRVRVGQATTDKQPIQIDWVVKDPAGKSVGTVSQKNDIPPGSLDGAWGQTADAAAAAAAQGIIKLLPGSQTRTN